LSGKLVQLKVSDLAFDGKAVAHRDGKVVFLDGGLPGETVLAEIVRSKPHYDQGIVHEVTERSASRIEPICPHFDHCGGCVWQDLAYEQQLQIKKKLVAECLARIGGLASVPLADVIPSAETFHYRNKMEFSFHTTDGGSFSLGLHRKGCFDDIFDLEACYLQPELATRVVHLVRDFVKREQIPVYDVVGHRGYMRFLILRQAKHTGQLMVNVVTNQGGFSARDRLVSHLVSECPELTTIIHGRTGKISNVATAEDEQVCYGPGFIEEELLGHLFRIRASSFFQVNSLQTEALYRAGFELLRPLPSDKLLDLYCGSGSIGILLASQVAEVIGVELVPEAIMAARENAELNQVDNIRFIEADTKNCLKALVQQEARFDAVVIDPPRAGLHPKALKRTIALGADRLLYFSCNPSTFARDARQLCEEGYSVSEIRPVDMFPHTRHIELVALFYK
jgi:23S rRNA (uracil1939-C5)-methyltransferase